MGAGSSLMSVTGCPRRRSEAAISQPMKPEPMTATLVFGAQARGQLAEVVERAQHADGGVVGAGDGQAAGLGACRQNALLVLELAPAAERDATRVSGQDRPRAR